MNISNNYSQTPFKALYCTDKNFYNKMLDLSKDSFKGERFRSAFKELNEAAEGDHIELSSVNTGIRVSRIEEGKPGTVVKDIALNPSDLIWGLVEAAKKLRDGE